MELPGLSSEECFNVTILDDKTHEMVEMFMVTLSSADPRIILTTTTLLITILDDDG